MSTHELMHDPTCMHQLPYYTFGYEEIMDIKNLRFWWKIRFWFFWVRIGTRVYSEPARFIRPSEAKKITENARMPRASFINLLNLVAKCTVNTGLCAASQCPTSTVFVNFCKILYGPNFKVVCLPVWSPWCDGQFHCFARGRSWVRTQPRTKFLPFESTARPQPSTTNRISFDFPSPFFDFASSFRINPFRQSWYPYLDKI